MSGYRTKVVANWLSKAAPVNDHAEEYNRPFFSPRRLVLVFASSRTVKSQPSVPRLTFGHGTGGIHLLKLDPHLLRDAGVIVEY